MDTPDNPFLDISESEKRNSDRSDGSDPTEELEAPSAP